MIVLLYYIVVNFLSLNLKGSEKESGESGIANPEKTRWREILLLLLKINPIPSQNPNFIFIILFA